MNAYTFVIYAYKDSPYLEPCIKSLKKQTVSSTTILYISTPSPYTQGMANKYGIPVFTRNGQNDAQADWNFTYYMVDSRLVTITHQDDVYHRQYVIIVQNR